MQEKERLESYVLCSIKGIGTASVKKLMQKAGAIGKIRDLPDEQLKDLLGEKRADCFKKGMDERSRREAQRRYYHMKERGILFLPLWDEAYPARLKEIADAPLALYGKGSLPESQKKTAAIVGARSCSMYGREMAKYFAAGLAGAGIVIVSGMARGIDGIAQLAALDAGGNSVAVLGCGVDFCYPPENRPLYERLEKEGCLLSEYPPGTEPQARLFPPRNRIISGLSDLVLVTEAREKSGTMITVDMALEQGREVYAVPGRITDRLSDGCNKLVKDGALVFLSPKDFMEGLRQSFPEKLACCIGKRTKEGEGPAMPPITPEEAVVLETLDLYPQPLEKIREQLQFKLTERGFRTFSNNLLTILMHLCLKGVAKQNSPGWFSLDI